MTWHTLDGKPLIGERLKRLAREVAARKEEAKSNPPAPKYDHSKPPLISPALKPYIDKIAADLTVTRW